MKSLFQWQQQLHVVHKATAVCDTDTQAKQENLRQILNGPQTVMQAKAAPSTQSHSGTFSQGLQALPLSLGSGSEERE